jgi:tetratricopeptide (TPR) repeat protein
MRTSIAAALLAFAAVATVGCQQIGGPAAGTGAVRKAMGVEQLRAEGIAQMEKGRYEGALRAFVEALSRQPDDVGLHYLLAVTYSHLDRKDDAILAFRYVVQHGKAGSQEVEAATRWLAGVGMLAVPVAPPAPADQPELATSSMEGRIVWADLEPDRVLPRMQMQLEGTSASNRGKRYGIHVHVNGNYLFPKVIPGDYRLRAQIGYTRLWDMDVTVNDGKTVLDLTQDNAVARDLLKKKS